MLQEFKIECCEVLQKDKNEKKNEIFETLKVLKIVFKLANVLIIEFRLSKSVIQFLYVQKQKYKYYTRHLNVCIYKYIFDN